ncbi:restriction endonuclease subunit M [Anaerobacillus alkalidiazotrophicus]|uniref:restriction endonuclease subunit M n=1 Tax=Anaerobacillus alkalidiazotrophicus TaxID=472963 RepID=UPI000A024C56|nr:N-6 DNA methylase [Anaerobacillus alkalidiazotrophicus]
MSWSQLILDYLDKVEEDVVEIFESERLINYDERIMQRFRKIETLPENSENEEFVRAYLTSKLVNELNYRPELIEFEREYKSAGRKKDNKPRIDILLKDKDENIFFFIEVKSPSKYEIEKEEAIEKQLYLVANNEEKPIKYLVYYTVVERNGELVDEVVIIDKEKYPTYKDWKDANEPSSSDKLPARYEKALKEPYVKNGKKDLYKNISLFELDGIRETLHNVLWGGGGTDDNEIFSSLVNIILAKIQDEKERNDGEQYLFQVLQYSSEENPDDTEQENPESVFKRVNELYRRALVQRLNIEERKAKKSNVITEEKFSFSNLAFTVQQLEKYSFTESLSNMNDGTDILGNFFEGIIRRGFKQTEGQFFTPHNIVQFLLYGLELDNLSIDMLNKNRSLPYIIDPSAGSGTFLIEAMKMITKTIKYKRKKELNTNEDVRDKLRELMPDYKENTWAKDYLYGIEHNFNLGTAIKVNMILHGDGNTNIFIKDGLLPFRYYTNRNGINILKEYKNEDKYYHGRDVNEQYDVIISNPPFNVDLAKETKRHLKSDFLFGDKKNSENLFIERWYQLLKEKGRLGVVLPESIFDTAENKYIRLFIFKYFNVRAVVSLPTLTFEDYTSTKTSLLFASKKSKSQLEEWNKLWNKYSNEWSLLKTRVENYRKVFIEGEKKDKYPSIKDHSEETIITNLKRYLKDYVNEEEAGIKDILIKYSSEIDTISKIDNDMVDYFGYVNVWWVFGEVSEKQDYSIFMAEADNVGYKKTKAQYLIMPNDLYDVEKAPNQLDVEGILSEYDKAIAKKKEAIVNNKMNFLKLEENKLETSDKNAKERLERKIEKIKSVTQKLEDELKEEEVQRNKIAKFTSKYYDKDGYLKRQYTDRTDSELLNEFEENGMLYVYKSGDVLIRESEKSKILDFMRGAKIWE